MREVKVGQAWKWSKYYADTEGFTVLEVPEDCTDAEAEVTVRLVKDGGICKYPLSYWDSQSVLIEEQAKGEVQEENNQLSPNVYQFPNGVQVRDISAHLTSFGGQAVQYIARATRLDGVVKGLPVQDIYKAIEILQWEAERMLALQEAK